MRKILLFLAWLLVMACAAAAQITNPNVVRYDGNVTPAGFPNGPATIAVCSSGGSGGPPCSPITLIYSDQTGTTQITQPFQVQPNGRFYFYAPAGSYVVQSYGTGYSTVLTNITLTSTSPTGGGLPSGGNVGQVVVNTGTGTGSWQDPNI